MKTTALCFITVMSYKPTLTVSHLSIQEPVVNNFDNQKIV